MGRMKYTFTWYIENYSHCWHKNNEELCSPQFYAYNLFSSAWCLCLYPRGESFEEICNISLFLQRRPADNDTDLIAVKYELSFLGADGLPLQSKETQGGFEWGDTFGYAGFLKMNEVLLRQKFNYLPEDTLRVRCKMWMENGDSRQMGQGFARTRIEIEKISFLHAVENFSSLESNQKNDVDIEVSSKKHCISSSIYLTIFSCCGGRIVMEITPPSTKQILSKCKIFLLDVAGNVKKCGEEDNRFDYTRRDISKIPLSLTRKVILNKKDENLVDDTLNLLCECTFSTGEKYEKIERILHEIPSDALNHINNDAENIFSCRSVLADLKDLYNTQLVSDVELKTATKSFRAHKNLLCARSSVFKAMLTHDMKEKQTHCIQVDDMEDETVEKFLQLLYSDALETLQKDCAIKLYYAADKYAVEKLKFMCSSILLENLNTSTVIELLLLADTHNDSYLKRFVEDFILNHEEEVFGSDEWGNLIETNPILVSKTMRLKYTRKDQII